MERRGDQREWGGERRGKGEWGREGKGEGRERGEVGDRTLIVGGIDAPDSALPVCAFYRAMHVVFVGRATIRPPWAPARGEQGGQAPTLEKIRVGGNFSRGLKTSWQ